MKSLEKLRECFWLRNTHQTLAAEAPDAEPTRPVCCQCLTVLGLGTAHRLNPAGASGVA